MIENEGNTLVYRISNKTTGKETLQSEAVANRPPLTCEAVEAGKTWDYVFKEPKISVSVLLDYLANDGAQKSTDSYLATQRNKEWQVFFNSGLGNGYFNFVSEESGLEFYFKQALNYSDDSTKILLTVLLLLNNKRFTCVPFWLSLTEVKFLAANNSFNFIGNLSLRTDFNLFPLSFCPWEIQARGEFYPHREQGRFFVMDHQDYLSK